MDRERLRRLRNIQSDDWYAALVMRPLSILVLYVVADWRWLTPNRITALATAAKLGAVALLLGGEWRLVVGGVAMLQVGTLLDHMDGTLARYRGAGSMLGSFFDKVSDAVTWFAITAALGWLAYQDEGDGVMLLLGTVSAYALLCTGYMKWLLVAETERKLRRDPAAAPPTAAPPTAPPERSARDWIVWFIRSLAQVYRFDEMDLYFWVGLLVLLDEQAILMWLLAVSQGARLVLLIGQRGWQAHRLDHPRT
jgi:phosphatidylglycerophosphate synthase